MHIYTHEHMPTGTWQHMNAPASLSGFLAPSFPASSSLLCLVSLSILGSDAGVQGVLRTEEETALRSSAEW